MRSKLIGTYLLFSVICYSQEIQWSPFVWYADTVNGVVRPKIALLIPCTIKGIHRKLLFQFDTGSNSSMIYEGPRQQYHLPITWAADSQFAFTTISATLGYYHIDSTRFSIHRNVRDTLVDNDPYPVVGTLGQDILVGKILILDFPHQRFSIFDSLNSVAETFLSKVSFVSLNRRNQKLFVTLQFGEIISTDFFFDTGASMFPIETTKEMWQKLTGFQGNEASLSSLKVPSWGKNIVLIGAPIKDGIRIRNLQVNTPFAYFDSTRTHDFAKWPFKTDGLFGSALFYDEYTVVLDLIKDRFGILKN
jgi:hypothetical protein